MGKHDDIVLKLTDEKLIKLLSNAGIIPENWEDTKLIKTFEYPLIKGEGKYQCTKGFIDLIIKITEKLDKHIEIIIEIKTCEDFKDFGSILRQIKEYRNYYENSCKRWSGYVHKRIYCVLAPSIPADIQCLFDGEDIRCLELDCLDKELKDEGNLEDEILQEFEEEETEMKKESPPIIYLAGKVGGQKWEVTKDCNATFISSDGSNHSEHNWGWGYYEFNSENMRENLQSRTIEKIKNCDFLIAYLDTNDSYGSIAEISYASALGKKCFVFLKIDKPLKDDREKLEEEEYIDELLGMHDVYWFVSHFPNVETIIASKKETNEIIKRICDRNQSKISKMMVCGFSSEVMLRDIKKEIKEDDNKTRSPI